MRYLHTMIRAANLDDTLDFFVDKLGLVEAYRYDNDAGRFTLVFLSAPDDLEGAKARQAPLVEITYNWDPETYDGGRNFGHLAYQVDDIYATCQRLLDKGVTLNRPPRDGRMAFHPLARRDFDRVIAVRGGAAATGAVAVDGEYR